MQDILPDALGRDLPPTGWAPSSKPLAVPHSRGPPGQPGARTQTQPPLPGAEARESEKQSTLSATPSCSTLPTGVKNSPASLVELSPTGPCVNLRKYFWGSRDPLARFFRTHYVTRRTFSPFVLRGANPEKHLWPSYAHCTPEDAGLTGGPHAGKLSSRTVQENFLMTVFLAIGSYLALGEPRELFTSSLGQVSPSHVFCLNPLHQKMVAERQKDIRVFLDAGEAGVEAYGKAANLKTPLDACQEGYGKPPPEGSDEGPPERKKAMQTPLPIAPAFMSLPKSGASHRLVLHLSPFLASEQHRPDLLQHPSPSRPLPRPRMHGAPLDALEYLRGHHGRGMAALAHPSWIPLAADGKPVNFAGSFGVPKSDSTPQRPRRRAITNRMPRNATQLSIRSACLPHGTLFTKIILPDGYYARVSMDDLPYYFHNLREEDKSALNNHIGKVYSVQELENAGFRFNALERAAGRLQIVLVALPMGFIYAVDLSQGLHEGMLIADDVTSFSKLLHYGAPIELWSDGALRVLHGVYIDDIGIVCIVPKDVALPPVS